MTLGDRSRENQALDAVVSRSAVDLAFRNELLVDPRKAIQQAFGIVIPPDFKIKFIERDVSVDALVVLPDFEGPAKSDTELSDEDLHMVSGGVAEDYAWANDTGDDQD